MIKASIIGVTGYTGLEVLRILLAHPKVKISQLTGRVDSDTPIAELFPHLNGYDYFVQNLDVDQIAKDSDVVFICLPHKASQDIVAALHGKVKVIDLSADYRLDDPEIYAKYYTEHKHPTLLEQVVYGAPEIVGRDVIAGASSVANPGCFALLGQLMLLPFKGQIDHVDLIAITGSSGSGKTLGEGTHHPIRSHNMQSYNINMHRHIPEITRTAGIEAEQLNFVPTSGPFVRGIFAQGFVTLSSPSSLRKQGSNNTDHQIPDQVREDIEATYAPSPFIRIMENNRRVALANIVGSNYCDLSYQMGHDGRILAQGALDNLVKGAAGNAVQNMNLMCGMDEALGLSSLSPVYP